MKRILEYAEYLDRNKVKETLIDFQNKMDLYLSKGLHRSLIRCLFPLDTENPEVITEEVLDIIHEERKSDLFSLILYNLVRSTFDFINDVKFEINWESVK